MARDKDEEDISFDGVLKSIRGYMAKQDRMIESKVSGIMKELAKIRREMQSSY